MRLWAKVTLSILLSASACHAQGAVFRGQNHKYRVLLTWTASVSAGVTGYNVYRNGTVIGSATTVTFADKTVQRHQTYMYDVTATDGTPGDESAPSNTFVVRIP